MASNFGRVVFRKNGWCLDFGRRAEPRFLYSARGARLESREMATSVLEAIRVAIARGTDPQSAVDEFAPTTSERNGVAHWWAEYLARQERRAESGDLSPGTLYTLKVYARRHILPYWEGKGLAEIDAFALEKWAGWLSRRLGQKSTANVLGEFRAFLRWLHRMERLERVPSFPSVRIDEHAPTIISIRTQALLLGAIPSDERGIFLAMAHGVRPGEARALDISDAQEREDVPGLLVHRGVKGNSATSPIRGSKNRSAAWIPVGDELVEWMEWRRAQRDGCWRSPALFVNPRTTRTLNPQHRWTENTLQNAWKLACAAVGVQVGLYEALKHSSASAWFSSGTPLPIVQRMLRHRDTRSTERYAKLSGQALVEAFRRRPKGTR